MNYLNTPCKVCGCAILKTEGYGYHDNGEGADGKPFHTHCVSKLDPVPEDTSVEIGTGDDPVNHPSHYTAGKVECINALEAATVNLTGIEAVCTANVIKYLWRWKQKNGVEDLKKAKWYIDRLIKT